MKRYRIVQYRQKCIGCNACVEVAAERWRMSRKDGKSVLLGATEKKGVYSVVIGEDEYEANRLAAEYCPVNIIRLQPAK